MTIPGIPDRNRSSLALVLVSINQIFAAQAFLIHIDIDKDIDLVM